MLKRLARELWRKAERAAAGRGYAVEWRPRPLLTRDQTFLADVEFAVPHLLLSVERPFFVGIGANDGKANDPLYPFIERCGLAGILLEPIPEVFERLAALHSGNSSVRCINAALAEVDGEATIYTVRMDGVSFDKAQQFSSFRKASLLSQTAWVPDVADRVIERAVRTVSFATIERLAAEAGADRIDILQTDTEGFDGEVLRLMRAQGIAPAIVNFERLHMDKVEIEGHVGMFLDDGYLVSVGASDVVAYRPHRRFTGRS